MDGHYRSMDGGRGRKKTEEREVSNLFGEKAGATGLLLHYV